MPSLRDTTQAPGQVKGSIPQDPLARASRGPAQLPERRCQPGCMPAAKYHTLDSYQLGKQIKPSRKHRARTPFTCSRLQPSGHGANLLQGGVQKVHVCCSLDLQGCFLAATECPGQTLAQLPHVQRPIGIGSNFDHILRPGSEGLQIERRLLVSAETA